MRSVTATDEKMNQTLRAQSHRKMLRLMKDARKEEEVVTLAFKTGSHVPLLLALIQ
jgi:hypothetical protein